MSIYDSHTTNTDNFNTDIHPYGPWKSYTWDNNREWDAPGIYVVDLHKPWNVIEANMTKCFGNLHAHVVRNSRDCDSTYENDYVTLASECNFNDSRERVNLSKESDGYDWANFKPCTNEAEFRYTLLDLDEWDTDPEYRFIVQDDKFEWFERARNTDEGYEWESLTFCWDWTCDTGAKRFRDHTAIAAGY